MTNPPAESVLRALEGLIGAGMVDPESGRLTDVGEKVAECPVEVNVARMVTESNSSVQILTRSRRLTRATWFAVVQFERVQMWRGDFDDRRYDLCSGSSNVRVGGIAPLIWYI